MANTQAAERNQSFPSLIQAVWVLMGLFGIEYMAATVFVASGHRFSSGDPKVEGVIQVISFGILFSLLMAYKNLGYRQLFIPAFRLNAKVFMLLLIPILIVIMGLTILVSNLDSIVIHYYPMSPHEIQVFTHVLNGGFISVITLVGIAPFLEEMLFRGIFLRSFLHRYSPLRSVLFSAALFGLAHLNIYQLAGAVVLGAFSGWLYVTTRSLWPSILIHSSFNAVGVLGALLSPDASNLSSEIAYDPWWVIGLAVLAITIGLFFVSKITKNLKEEGSG